MDDAVTGAREQRGAVWVTRPADSAASTARAIEAAAYSVVSVPVLGISVVPPDPLPAGPWPDWVVFVSKNAVAGLDSALDVPGFPKPDDRGKHAVRCAAVGRRTAERAEASDWHVLLVPEQESAHGLLCAFERHDLAGRRVWIPAGSRAGSAIRELPEGLRAAGAIPQVFQVYETRERELTEFDVRALDAVRPGAVIVHSPSAAEAIYASGAMPALDRWRKEAVAVAIGPATAKSLEKLGAFEIHVCREPSDDGILEALAAIDRLGQPRSGS